MTLAGFDVNLSCLSSETISEMQLRQQKLWGSGPLCESQRSQVLPLRHFEPLIVHIRTQVTMT